MSAKERDDGEEQEMLLRPRPPHRSLARRRADADGRTDTAAANRADFTVVLLRDSRGGRRRRRRPPPAFPSARAVNRPLLRGSPFTLPPVRSVVVVLPLLIRTVAGSRAWRKPPVDFGQCSSRDGPYRPIDRWETAMNSASEGGRQRRRRKKRRRMAQETEAATIHFSRGWTTMVGRKSTFLPGYGP